MVDSACDRGRGWRLRRGVTVRLKDNGIEPVSFVGSWESIEKTKDGALGYANKRAEVWWKFREG